MTDPAAPSGGEEKKSSMGKWVALAPIVLIVVAMGAIGYHHATRNKIRHAAGSLSGQQLYDMYCARCHMANLQGAGAYPSVVARDLTLDEVRTIVLNGKNTMPAFKDMDATDLERLHGFLAERRAGAR